MKLGRHQPMPHHQHDLDNSRDARHRLGVANIALHRTDVTRGIVRPAATKDLRQRLQLDRVAQRRCGAVRFQITHLIRRPPCLRKCCANDSLLRTSVRGGDARRAAVLINGTRADDRQHLIPISGCVGQPLEDQERAPFASHIAVGGRVERATPAIGRQHVRFGKRNGRFGRENQIDSARQGRITFAIAQALDRRVNTKCAR